ncbi:MAG TPA: chorismate mutase, partial [Steroidobacteraceae bacterium]|nr:chorismate mutase [Steroidobacteraceae bacterium]
MASKKKTSVKKTSNQPAAETAAPDLAKIRAQIDSIDDQLLKLLSERANFAQAVGLSKKNEVTSTA